MNGANGVETETVIATGEDLLDALTDALLQIKPRIDTSGNYLVRIDITKEVEKQDGNN